MAIEWIQKEREGNRPESRIGCVGGQENNDNFEIRSKNRLSSLLVTVLWPFSRAEQEECGEQRTGIILGR